MPCVQAFRGCCALKHSEPACRTFKRSEGKAVGSGYLGVLKVSCASLTHSLPLTNGLICSAFLDGQWDGQ